MSRKNLGLIIVGRMSEERGKMARFMCEGCVRMGIDHLLVEGPPFPRDLPSDAVVLHVSSKERVPAVIEECERLHLPLIQASSGVALPENPGIPIIDAPNLALPIVALFDVLPRLGILMQDLGADVEVAESH